MALQCLFQREGILYSWARIVSPGIDSQPGGPVRQPYFDEPARQATEAGWIDALESTPGLLERLKIQAVILFS